MAESSASPEPRCGHWLMHRTVEHSQHLRIRDDGFENVWVTCFDPPASSRHSDGEALIAALRNEARAYELGPSFPALVALLDEAADALAARPAPPGGLVEDGTTSPSQTVGAPTVTGDGAAEREGQHVGVCEFCTCNVVVVHQEASDHRASLERLSPRADYERNRVAARVVDQWFECGPGNAFAVAGRVLEALEAAGYLIAAAPARLSGEGTRDA